MNRQKDRLKRSDNLLMHATQKFHGVKVFAGAFVVWVSKVRYNTF